MFPGFQSIPKKCFYQWAECSMMNKFLKESSYFYIDIMNIHRKNNIASTKYCIYCIPIGTMGEQKALILTCKLEWLSWTHCLKPPWIFAKQDSQTTQKPKLFTLLPPTWSILIKQEVGWAWEFPGVWYFLFYLKGPHEEGVRWMVSEADWYSSVHHRGKAEKTWGAGCCRSASPLNVMLQPTSDGLAVSLTASLS